MEEWGKTRKEPTVRTEHEQGRGASGRAWVSVLVLAATLLGITRQALNKRLVRGAKKAKKAP